MMGLEYALALLLLADPSVTVDVGGSVRVRADLAQPFSLSLEPFRAKGDAAARPTRPVSVSVLRPVGFYWSRGWGNREAARAWERRRHNP